MTCGQGFSSATDEGLTIKELLYHQKSALSGSIALIGEHRCHTFKVFADKEMKVPLGEDGFAHGELYYSKRNEL